MSLQSGTKLGPYEILDQIGAGGMGEVYKAADQRLNRTVAVKVLPTRFSDDPEMKQRFDREAKTVASLNHPHICTLHDIGQAEIDGEDAGSKQTVDYLVMEYLEGESLAEQLGRGALPLDEALKVAVEIADGLEKAHAHGVTHRDLKPGNVMLTPGGAKLLDFGLAKLQQAPQAGADSSISATGANTTTPGTIMGTMQYMAPEQLEGKEADARTDIFAFGAVLYELVTGRKAFEGKSQPHLIAAIVSTQPDPVSTIEATAPRVLDFLVERCLEKDPEHRLQTATDLVWELRWIAEGGTQTAPRSPQRGRLTQAAPYAAAAMGVLVIALGVLAFVLPGGADADNVTRFLIDVPDMPVAEAISISPDGRTIAFSARDGGSTAVFIRPMLVDEPQRLEGTDGAERLFWSPDSRWIAFYAGGLLKRVEATGGPPQNITETEDLFGGTYNADDEIVFGSSQGLQRVLAIGGEPTPVAVSIDGDETPQEPFFLPDGRGFLFTAGDAIYAGSLDSPDVKQLVTAQSNAAYAEPGYLLYHREGTLYAQPFDAGGLTLEGEAIRMADGLPVGTNGSAAFAASHTGVLIYRNDPVRVPETGGPAGGVNVGNEPPLMWVDVQGGSEAVSEPRRWVGVDLSPDGGRAAAHWHEPDGGDIWTFNLGEPTPARFTFDASQENAMPIWSPDGTEIAFASQREGTWGLWVKPADRSRDEELVIETDFPALPMSWTPDGNTLVFSMNAPDTSGDIWSVSLEPGAEAVPVLQTGADERNPQVSPDGRLIAYSSDFTGQSEIYIRPFPEGPGETQVSVDGGVFPRWRSDSRELYFMNLVSYGGMMASEITVNGQSIVREVPRRLFQTWFVSLTDAPVQHHAYAVSGDGEQYLIPQFTSFGEAFGGGTGGPLAGTLPPIVADRGGTGFSPASNGPITVVLNWPVAARP